MRSLAPQPLAAGRCPGPEALVELQQAREDSVPTGGGAQRQGLFVAVVEQLQGRGIGMHKAWRIVGEDERRRTRGNNCRDVAIPERGKCCRAGRILIDTQFFHMRRDRR